MRFDRRFVIVVGCSLLWALLVATLFHRMTGGGGGRGRSTGPARPLVVAAQPLPLGAIISNDSVKIVDVPGSLFPKGGFSRKEEVLDRPVTSLIDAEEPVVEARIAPRGSGAGLGPLIPPGMRAVSVRVNDVAGVAGYVLPGMRVDVLVTGRPPEKEDMVTTTVLQNIPVLSAGQNIQTDGKGQPISATVVTLLVNPAQAEALTLASNEGRLQLVLRNATDQQVAHTSGRRLRELYAVDAVPSKLVKPESTVPLPAAAPAPRPRKPPAPPATAVAAPTASQAARPPADEVVLIRGTQKIVEPAPRVNH